MAFSFDNSSLRRAGFAVFMGRRAEVDGVSQEESTEDRQLLRTAIH